MRTQKNAPIKTTIGELASAFYEAALSELKNPVLAAQVAQQMVRNAMSRQHVLVR